MSNAAEDVQHILDAMERVGQRIIVQVIRDHVAELNKRVVTLDRRNMTLASRVLELEAEALEAKRFIAGLIEGN